MTIFLFLRRLLRVSIWGLLFDERMGLTATDWLLNCCWSSLAQWLLVPGPAGFMTIFYCLTDLGAFKRHISLITTTLIQSSDFLLLLASTVVHEFEPRGIHGLVYIRSKSVCMFGNGTSYETRDEVCLSGFSPLLTYWLTDSLTHSLTHSLADG
jgi:hypothetical protein